MSSDLPTSPGKICPTCGTRISASAVRCPVCRTDLTTRSTSLAEPIERITQVGRMPEITLSLPVALVALAFFLGLGAVLVFFVLRSTGRVVEPTPTASPTLTQTPTLTPTPITPTPTNTPLPSPTPYDYTVAATDTCIAIAARFEVSITSIVLLNNLPADCGTLFVGQKLLIPQPTPTNTPLPTATLSDADATEQACEKVTYTVQENDTLSGIASRYAIPIAAIREYNGLPSDVVYSGINLIIPLCKRAPTPGPSPTPSPPPPYAAPNLLLPADGAPFSQADKSISLQWASVGTLRENEAYAVTIEDVTEGQGRKIVKYVTDTKLIVPVDFLPNDTRPHVFRWAVEPVRQIGTNESGEPIWESAGAVSTPRVFIGSGAPGAATPTPQ